MTSLDHRGRRAGEALNAVAQREADTASALARARTPHEPIGHRRTNTRLVRSALLVATLVVAAIAVVVVRRESQPVGEQQGATPIYLGVGFSTTWLPKSVDVRYAYIDGSVYVTLGSALALRVTERSMNGPETGKKSTLTLPGTLREVTQFDNRPDGLFLREDILVPDGNGSMRSASIVVSTFERVSRDDLIRLMTHLRWSPSDAVANDRYLGWGVTTRYLPPGYEPALRDPVALPTDATGPGFRRTISGPGGRTITIGWTFAGQPPPPDATSRPSNDEYDRVAGDLYVVASDPEVDEQRIVDALAFDPIRAI